MRQVCAERILLYGARPTTSSKPTPQNRKPSAHGWYAKGHDPNGIRTRVAALKGPCPRPLDDGAGFSWLTHLPPRQGQEYADVRRNVNRGTWGCGRVTFCECSAISNFGRIYSGRRRQRMFM